MHYKLSLPFVALAFLGGTACQSDEPDDQDELQTLLHDDQLDLTQQNAAVAPATRTAGIKRSGTESHVVQITANPAGTWAFDDCSPDRANLADGTLNANVAYRSIGVACGEGVDGTLGVKLAHRQDIVYVPDQPSFGLDQGVTVAGWFKPTSTGGTDTLFRKRNGDSSSFALVLNNNRFQFVVAVGHFAISVTAPQRAKAGVYQHVAGSYDGKVLRLYVDGAEVSHFNFRGTMPTGDGPLVIGNDGSERRFDGGIDNALFATHALTATEIAALLHHCHALPPAVVADPFFFTFAPAGSPTQLRVDLFNNEEDLACPPMVFQLETQNPGFGLTIDPAPFTTVFSDPVPPQGAGSFTINVTPDTDNFNFQDFFANFSISEPSLNYFVTKSIQIFTTAPTECVVSTKREILMKDLSIVDDPIRTVFDPASTDPRNGVWTFKHVVENLAVTPAAAPAMVEHWLSTFNAPLTINGFTAVARPNMKNLVLDRWPRTPDGKLDLAKAPLRLNAIVSRTDLRDLSKGDAGEGRFVFAFNDPDFAGFGLRATVIFEFKLPAQSQQDVLDWANSFHALGGMKFGEDYNAALQAITERFAGRGVRPGFPNGSAINAVRTNDIDFSTNFDIWEMREFRLSPTTGGLEPAPTDLVPDVSFNNTPTLASYINQNEADILAEKHSVPLIFNRQHFEAAATFNELVSWIAPGVKNNEARHKFAINTCNGCHGQQETNVRFLQIFPRFEGTEAVISTFLEGGVTIHDPVSGKPRSFNELGRRNADLRSLVCPGAAPLSWSPSTIAKGSSRVH